MKDMLSDFIGVVCLFGAGYGILFLGFAFGF